ncbi:MAG: ATP-binding protein [Pseudomonadota bacterium]
MSKDQTQNSANSATQDSLPLKAVLATEELFKRPTRAPDFAKESSALAKLVKALASSPQDILQIVTDITLDASGVGSAGICLLSKDKKNLTWRAISGQWAQHAGGVTPRNFGASGDVLDANTPLLFQHPERRYHYLAEAVATPVECLVVPFHVEGIPVGTIWIIAHDDVRKFDTEDLRLLQSLAEFASAAYQVIATQAELKESEERFRSYVTASSDIVYRMNHDWTELHQLIGRNLINDVDEPNQNWLEDYVDPSDHDYVRNVIEEGLRTKNIIEIESRVRRVDGDVAWSYSRAVPRLDANGEIIEWIGSGYDVTERRKTADALRNSEERYRNLFNSMDEGYCIIDLLFDDANNALDYTLLEVNPAFAELTGMRNAVGKHISELAVKPEAYWFEIFGKVALTGEPVRFINKAASLENHWFDVNAFKVGESSSRKVAVLFKDITQQKNAEDALRASEVLYRSLFNSIDEGFGIIEMIFDEDNVAVDFLFEEVNPAFAQQTGMYDVVGKRIRELVHDHEEFWLPMLGQVALTGATARIEAEAQALKRWLSVQAFRVGDHDSRKVAVILSNVTERREAERKLSLQAEELAELNRRKNEFLAMLSHELRNPLAPLANAVQLMQLQQHDEALQRQARDIIERQVSQLKHLIDDLLEISRITTGRVLLRLKQTTANGVLERALETTRPLFMQRNQHLVAEIPSSPIWLRADPARLEQVIVNLLTNASKFTDEGGRIEVVLAEQQDEAVLTVRDNGIGISAEQLPHIFDLFTQAERSLDRSQGGLGIGLCLVRQLLELHGGTVDASSVLGQGSEFTVRLKTLDNSQLQTIDIEGGEKKSAEKHFRILVVDDNVDAAHTLSMLLQMVGHDTQITFDGASAVDASIEYVPDVILLDIGLPEIDGYEAAKLIRQQEGLEHVVLIALTGYGREMDRAMTQKAGFDHHLVKPAEFSHLLKILANIGEPTISG